MQSRRVPLFIAAGLAAAALVPMTSATAAQPGTLPVSLPAVVTTDADQAELDAMAPAVPGLGTSRTHVFAQRGYATSGGNGPLVYHGGALLPEAHLYAIFWGSFSSSTYVPGLKSFLGSMVCGGAASACAYPSNSHLSAQYWPAWTGSNSTQTVITFSDTNTRVFFDTSTAPPKTGPSTSAIVNEVAKVLLANNAPTDPLGLYLVFTSNYPSGVRYCAWHSAGSINGTRAAVGYEPNLGGVSGCSVKNYALYAQKFPSASTAKVAVDSTANVATHEIYEAMTDPMTSGNGWYDASGNENGDKCTWYYGADYQNGYVMQPEYDNGLSIIGGSNLYATNFGSTAPCANF